MEREILDDFTRFQHGLEEPGRLDHHFCHKGISVEPMMPFFIGAACALTLLFLCLRLRKWPEGFRTYNDASGLSSGSPSAEAQVYMFNNNDISTNNDYSSSYSYGYGDYSSGSMDNDNSNDNTKRGSFLKKVFPNSKEEFYAKCRKGCNRFCPQIFSLRYWKSYEEYADPASIRPRRHHEEKNVCPHFCNVFLAVLGWLLFWGVLANCAGDIYSSGLLIYMERNAEWSKERCLVEEVRINCVNDQGCSRGVAELLQNGNDFRLAKKWEDNLSCYNNTIPGDEYRPPINDDHYLPEVKLSIINPDTKQHKYSDKESTTHSEWSYRYLSPLDGIYDREIGPAMSYLAKVKAFPNAEIDCFYDKHSTVYIKLDGSYEKVRAFTRAACTIMFTCTTVFVLLSGFMCTTFCCGKYVNGANTPILVMFLCCWFLPTRRLPPDWCLEQGIPRQTNLAKRSILTPEELERQNERTQAQPERAIVLPSNC